MLKVFKGLGHLIEMQILLLTTYLRFTPMIIVWILTFASKEPL
jgi:hypothetical protein